MNTTQFRLTLLGLALGVLIALLIAPQTRWLVRLQTLTLLHQYRPLLPSTWTGGAPAYYTTSGANDTRLYHAAAVRHPGDFGLQYANAALGSRLQVISDLRTLASRFPNNPLLLANLLRWESDGIRSNRPDDFLLLHEPVLKTIHYIPSTPETLAAYDRDAAAGERADPDNAYFPLMRASGLFAAHRDAEALAAVQRASVKPFWHEYLTDDNEAHWRLHAEAFHDPGAMPQASNAAGQILWQYGSLRETARLVAYQAVLQEQAGHPEEGLALREALLRCGDLMRVQSTALIGSLVGIAVAAISETRPGGPFVKYDASLTPEQKAQKRLDTYCAYAVKIGHPEAARQAREEEAARRSVQALEDPEHLIEDWTRPLVQCSWWWVADLAALLNIGWLLVLGMAAAGRARLTLAPKTPPIGGKAVLVHCLLAVGAWLVLALLFVCVSGAWVTLVYHAPIDWQMTFGVAGVFGLVTWLVGSSLRRLPRLRRVSILKTALLLPVIVGGLYGLYCFVLWLAGPLADIPANLQALIGLSGSSGDSDAEQARQMQTLQLCALSSLAVPLLLALVLSLAALVRRVSLPRTLATGFQRFALPLACLLLVVYGGLLVETLRQERRLSEFTRQAVSGGGRYFAARAGQTWPGPVQ